MTHLFKKYFFYILATKQREAVAAFHVCEYVLLIATHYLKARQLFKKMRGNEKI